MLGGITALFAFGANIRANNMAYQDTAPGTNKELEGGFIHIVFFWLIDDSQEVKQKFMKELKGFTGQVEEINKVHIGPPADTNRDVIDNTWSYSLVVTFDSKIEHDIYQEHQAHLKFIENASSLWKKLLVYDSIKT